MSVPAHLAAVANTARTLSAQGRLPEARTSLEQALDTASMMLGPDHPEVLAATQLLAAIHRDLGELSEARRLLEEAVAAGYYPLGDSHPLLLSIYHDLAGVAHELGNLHEARKHFGTVARLGPAAFGDGHPFVRAARGYLGLPDPPTVAPPAPVPAHPPVTGPGVPARPSTPDAARPPAVSPPSPAPPTTGDAGTPGPGPDSTVSLDAPTAVHPLVSAPARPFSQPQPARPAPPPAPLPLPPPRTTPPPPPPIAAYDRDGGRGRTSRAPLVALAVVGVLVVLGGAVAGAVVLTSRGPTTPPVGQRSTQPAPTAEATRSGQPTGLRLRDSGSSVTLTWKDPSSGTVPFIVAGGRDGNYRTLQTVSSGTTLATLNGLNPTADYCFTVVAVYSTDRVVPSDPVCTRRRGGPSGTPESATRS